MGMNKVFSGRGLRKTVRRVTAAYDVCIRNNPQTHPLPPPLLRPIWYQGIYPEEDRQVDFIQMPPKTGFKYLSVSVDMFTRWVEAFPT